MARKKTSKKVSKRNGSTALAGILDVGGETGFEEAVASDYAIPMLTVLQKLSPQVDKDDEAYVKGAKPGMIFHNVRQEAYESVNVIPAMYRKVFLEWVLRENGGGFRGEVGYSVGLDMRNGCTVNDKNQFILPNGNHLAETANYYCHFQYSPGLYEPVLISMASSQLKTSKLWFSQLGGMTYEEKGQVHADLPLWSYGWDLTTVKLENDKGKWYGWKTSRADFVLLEMNDTAKSLRVAIAQEQITYNPEQQPPADNSL